MRIYTRFSTSIIRVAAVCESASVCVSECLYALLLCCQIKSSGNTFRSVLFFLHFVLLCGCVLLLNSDSHCVYTVFLIQYLFACSVLTECAGAVEKSERIIQ